MKHATWLMCSFVLLAQPAPDAAQKDLQALQGEWTMAALEVNGQDVPPDRLGNTTVRIKGSDYVIKIKDKTFPVVVKLDPSRDPKEMDMVPQDGAAKDKVHKAIYKIEKDTFILCRGLNPDQDRPREFATWPNTNYFVVKWKKN